MWVMRRYVFPPLNGGQAHPLFVCSELHQSVSFSFRDRDVAFSMKIYDLNGCSTTAVFSLVFRVFLQATSVRKMWMKD